MKPGDGITIEAGRRIVHVATMAEGTLTQAGLYALCNDGTLWSMGAFSDGWQECRPIPQPESGPPNPNRPLP